MITLAFMGSCQEIIFVAFVVITSCTHMAVVFIVHIYTNVSVRNISLSHIDSADARNSTRPLHLFALFVGYESFDYKPSCHGCFSMH